MNDDEILTLLKSSLDEIAPGWAKGVSEFGQHVKFRDLSVDSVQVMEMVGIIEDKCACEFSDEDLAGIHTVGDMVTLIRKVAT